MNRLVKIKIRDAMIRARTLHQHTLEHGVENNTAPIKRSIKDLTNAIVDLEKEPET